MKVKFNWKKNTYSAISALCMLSGLYLLVKHGSHVVYIFVSLFALGVFVGVKGRMALSIKKDKEKDS
jgi:hypothetical protein